MTTSHHRVQTHGRWQVKQPFPGRYLWRDAHGAVYLVDHTGTRRLADTGPPEPLADTAVDLYPDTGEDITYQVEHVA